MELPISFIEESSLSFAQYESLVSYRKVRSHETTLREAAASRHSTRLKTGTPKIGSYYRTVRQGQDNIRSSILTVVIALWTGLVKGEELKRLLDQVGRPLPELYEADIAKVISLVDTLTTRIVMQQDLVTR